VIQSVPVERALSASKEKMMPAEYLSVYKPEGCVEWKDVEETVQRAARSSQKQVWRAWKGGWQTGRVSLAQADSQVFKQQVSVLVLASDTLLTPSAARNRYSKVSS
jgi:hypothetical protein